jgi:hypothetical protein
VPEKNLFILPYEKLVATPKKTIESLCKFLGEDFDPSMLDIRSHNSSELRQSEGIYSISANSWRERLSNEETWIAQKLAGKDMEKLGYQQEPVTANLLKVCWFFITSPIALYKGLQANKNNTGPIIPYLVHRIKSLLR